MIDPVQKTKGVDLLLPEALIKAHQEFVKDNVKKAMKYQNRSVVYSDSALHPDGFQFKEALSYANKYSRPVQFIRWGQELPIIDLTVLCEQNILSLLQTGRYVDVHRLERMCSLAQSTCFTSAKNSLSQHELALNAGQSPLSLSSLL